MRAFWNYYRTVNLLNILFSIAAGFSGKFFWIPVMFCTAGLAFGIFAFNTFFRNQYYFYHNIGYTRLRLAKMMFIANLIPSLLLLLLYYLIS